MKFGQGAQKYSNHTFTGKILTLELQHQLVRNVKSTYQSTHDIYLADKNRNANTFHLHT